MTSRYWSLRAAAARIATIIAHRVAIRLGIRSAFIALIVFLIGVTSATIGITAYWNTRLVVDDLSDVILSEVTDKAVARTTSYLRSATPIIELSRSMLAEGIIDPKDSEALTDHLYRVLRAHTQFTWAWYANEDGNGLGAFRLMDGRLGVNRMGFR